MRRFFPHKSTLAKWHLDGGLLGALLLLLSFGLFILYSAGNQSVSMILQQGVRILIAFGVLFALAQISPQQYRRWTPWIFGCSIVLLLAVLAMGVIGKGAQRWLNLWIFQFQPSELLKLAIPMMLAYYLHDKILPPGFKNLIGVFLIILLPTMLIAKQPDLGTALLVTLAGLGVIFLAGLRARWWCLGLLIFMVTAPFIWHFMHDYQRERLLIFLNPENDPLGAGYHIIQSKIAIGSGGWFGKGWLQGTQSHLQFLPEHTTDFIFSVCGEELGLAGALFLLALYLLVAGRGLYIAANAQDTYSRLLAGGISMTFFISVFVNMGMATGILPVVGVPLPLVSYGGTSVITLIASFGILMSIQTHRKLLGR